MTYVNVIICIYGHIHCVYTALPSGNWVDHVSLAANSFTETKGREKTLNGLSLYQNCYVMLLPKRPFPVFVLMDIINNIGGLGKGWGVTIYLDGSFKIPS